MHSSDVGAVHALLKHIILLILRVGRHDERWSKRRSQIGIGSSRPQYKKRINDCYRTRAIDQATGASREIKSGRPSIALPFRRRTKNRSRPVGVVIDTRTLVEERVATAVEQYKVSFDVSKLHVVGAV